VQVKLMSNSPMSEPKKYSLIKVDVMRRHLPGELVLITLSPTNIKLVVHR